MEYYFCIWRLTTRIESFELFQIEQFSGVGIEHAFFTRQGGMSSGIYQSLNCGTGSKDNKEAVLNNRAKAMAALSLPSEALITCHQTHSSEAITITNENRNKSVYVGDGLITNIPKVALGILTADCSPVLFSDRKNSIIGAAHAGWKGAIGGILESTISGMTQQGAQIDEISCAIGPTIGPLSYEVGPEFPKAFLDSDPGNVKYFQPSKQKNHFMFDLPSFIESRLSKIGIEKIFQLERDTYQDTKNFYSYRRSCHKDEEDYGRLLSTIVIL